MEVSVIKPSPASVPVSEMPTNSFAEIVYTDDSISWHVGDILYRPVCIRDHICCPKQGTWGETTLERSRLRVRLLGKGDSVTFTL